MGLPGGTRFLSSKYEGPMLGGSANPVNPSIGGFWSGTSTGSLWDGWATARGSDQAGGTEVVDGALLALRGGGLANRPPVLDEHVGEAEPVLLRHHRHQVPLNLVGILLLRESQPSG